MDPISSTRVFKKLESIYQAAIRTSKWHTAFRVAQLMGSTIGMFEKRRFPNVKRLSEMSKKELQDFLVVIEKHDPELQFVNPQEEVNYPKKKILIPKHPPPCVCPECLSYE